MSGSDDAVRELFGRGSIYTVATALQLSGGVLILPAATRLLGPTAYGAVATAIVIIQVLMMIAALGFPAAITRAHFAPELGITAGRRLVGAGAISALAVTGLLGLLAPIWVRLFAEFRDWILVTLALAGGGMLAVVQASQALLRARGDAWRFAVVAVVSSVGGHAFGLLLAFVFRSGAATYLSGMVLGAAVGLVLALRATGAGTADRGLVRWALLLGAPTLPHLVALYVMQAGDRIVVERYLGLEQVGGYHVAYVVGALGATLVAGLNNAWAPLIYGASDKNREQALVATSRQVHRLAAYLAAGVALLAPFALRVAASAEFQPDALVPVVAVVALATMPQVTYLSQVHLLFHHQRTQALLFVSPTAAALNIVLNVLLIPRFGLVAAAATTVIAYTVQALLIGRARRRVETVAWDMRSQSLSYGIAVVGCVAGVALSTMGTGVIVRLVLAAGVAIRGFSILRTALRVA